MSRFWDRDAITPIPVPDAQPLLFAATLHDPAALACPVCGGGKVRLTAGAHSTDADAAVSFSCEGGDHPFELRFHLHKGTTFVSVVPTPSKRALLDERIDALRRQLDELQQRRSDLTD